MQSNTVGTRIAELRKRAGLTQVELADLASLHDSHIGLIESGRRKALAASTLGNIARVFGVSIELLTSGLGKEPTARALAKSVEKARGQHAA